MIFVIQKLTCYTNGYNFRYAYWYTPKYHSHMEEIWAIRMMCLDIFYLPPGPRHPPVNLIYIMAYFKLSAENKEPGTGTNFLYIILYYYKLVIVLRDDIIMYEYSSSILCKLWWYLCGWPYICHNASWFDKVFSIIMHTVSHICWS